MRACEGVWSVQPQYDAWDNPGPEEERGYSKSDDQVRAGRHWELKASFLGLIWLPEAL